MRETSKCKDMRTRRGDFENWLHGDVIDLGAGNDPLEVGTGSVTPFDRQHGDAQTLEQIGDGRYDCVYSSHCLEHLRDVQEALWNWVRVTKPGGYLYVVIPDFTYYEKCRWPSAFNLDHKQTFSMHLSRRLVGRSSHHNIVEDVTPILVSCGADLLSAWLELEGFDFNRFADDQTRGPALSQITFIAQKRLARH